MPKNKSVQLALIHAEIGTNSCLHKSSNVEQFPQSSLCPGCMCIGRGRRGSSIVSAAGAEAAVDAGAVGVPCPNGTKSPQRAAMRRWLHGWATCKQGSLLWRWPACLCEWLRPTFCTVMAHDPGQTWGVATLNQAIGELCPTGGRGLDCIWVAF